MWAVGMFRQQPSLIQRNRSISSSIHSPSSRYQALPLPWSPPQPKPPVESISPSCPCLQCFCVECTLCTAYSGQKPCFSHHCIPPWPAQCSCSISWVKFSLANSIENTFPTYLGPSHRRCPGSVTQGMEGQQEEKMLIFYRVVQGEAYKWDWGLPSLTESVWLERDRIYLIHPCIMDDLPQGALLDWNTLFICQRMPQKQHSGLWEKMEAGESCVGLNQPCEDRHSAQFRGNFKMKRNVLQW